jgi:RNA recognition motif-containing protein
MNIIVNGITKNTTATDIQSMVHTSMKRSWLYPSCVVDSVEIFHYDDNVDFALITLIDCSEKLYKRVIESINRQVLNGSVLTARKTVFRDLSKSLSHYPNDRRKPRLSQGDSSMKLFICNISHNTTKAEIYRLLTSIKVGLFRRVPEISDIQVIKITNLDYYDVEYHAMVTIPDAKTAEKILSRLPEKTLHGRPVRAHYYVNRLSTDQRFKDTGEKQSNKRRTNLKIDHITEDQLITQAYIDFSRIYN